MYNPLKIEKEDDVYIMTPKIRGFMDISLDGRKLVMVRPYRKSSWTSFFSMLIGKAPPTPLVTIIDIASGKHMEIKIPGVFHKSIKGAYAHPHFHKNKKYVDIRIGFSKVTTTIDLETGEIVEDGEDKSEEKVSWLTRNKTSDGKYELTVVRNLFGRRNYVEGNLSDQVDLVDDKRNVIQTIVNNAPIKRSMIIDDRFIFTDSFSEARLTPIIIELPV